jgi:hypothetical protein
MPTSTGHLESYLDQRLPMLIEPRTRQLPYAMGQRVPTMPDLEPGASTVSQIVIEELGSAQLREGTATDLPISTATYHDRDFPVRAIWSAITMEYQEMRRADFATAKGAPNMIDRKINIARRAIEEAENRITAFGKSNMGFDGFINHPDITPDADESINLFAGATTDDEIYEFFFDKFNDVAFGTSMVVSPKIYKKLSMPRVNTDTTIMQLLMTNLAPLGLSEIAVDTELAGSELNAQGIRGDATKDRIVIYEKNPTNLERHIEIIQRAPTEQRNGVTVIPLFKCMTPVLVNHPESIGYFDVLNSAA